MKNRVNLAQFVPAIVFILYIVACAVPNLAIPTPTPISTNTPTATVTPASTPTVVPTPVVLIAPQPVFNFFAAQILEQFQDAELSPYMGIMIWYEQEGQQYGAMFGVNIQTGQWVWIDNIPVEKEPSIDSGIRTY